MMGAIVGLRLASSISSVLEFLVKQATFWSDSMCYGGFEDPVVSSIHSLRIVLVNSVLLTQVSGGLFQIRIMLEIW